MMEFKKKMEQLSRNSKQWWSLNKRLLNRQASPWLFPPFKCDDGSRYRTPKTKADAFAKCCPCVSQDMLRTEYEVTLDRHLLIKAVCKPVVSMFFANENLGL